MHRLLKDFGQVPKIKFEPHGKDVYYKAEIMRKAGLASNERSEKIGKQKKPGFQGALDEERLFLARQFVSEWNNLMHTLLKSARALVHVNYALTRNGEKVAEPIRLVQGIVLQETKI
jgi:hypothetical protein